VVCSRIHIILPTNYSEVMNTHITIERNTALYLINTGVINQRLRMVARNTDKWDALSLDTLTEIQTDNKALDSFNAFGLVYLDLDTPHGLEAFLAVLNAGERSISSTALIATLVNRQKGEHTIVFGATTEHDYTLRFSSEIEMESVLEKLTGFLSKTELRWGVARSKEDATRILTGMSDREVA
jgi:hypothetical protein